MDNIECPYFIAEALAIDWSFVTKHSTEMPRNTPFRLLKSLKESRISSDRNETYG